MLGEKEWPSLQILLVLNSKQDDIKSNFTSINSTAKTKWTNFFKDTNYQNWPKGKKKKLETWKSFPVKEVWNYKYFPTKKILGGLIGEFPQIFKKELLLTQC